ncbi:MULTISPECIES: secretion protein EspA [Burkholderia]|uniref:secretion protein EspA n=1 Tax=Burkholderia TaxID=32008 RepID=UPI000754D99D|nr:MULTISPECIES: secretion protein EspA [Burkholderia]KVK89754.1 secretion protein EspA [Burkholderia sp. MSMB1498]KWZ49218.1 secretion protein EspA [Burkholderia savannae]
MQVGIERQGAASVGTQYAVDAPGERNVANSHPIGDSIAMMLVIMDLLSRQTTAKLDDMQKKSNISRDAQDMANKVEAALAKLVKPEDKTELPADVLKYMKDNDILVNGMTIDEFIAAKTAAGPDPRKFAQMLEKMQSMIDKADVDGMTSTPWQDVVSYMDSLGIKIDGKRVCDYIWSLPEVNYRPGQKISVDHMKTIMSALQGAAGLDKADLMSVKSSLESVSGRASDFIQQSQLKMQQLMQNYNTAVQMINSLQSMLAESTKGIASAIR